MESQDDGSDITQLTAAELDVAARGLVTLKAPRADASATSVNGTTYAVRGGVAHVEPRDVDALLAHGFTRG